MIRQLSDQYDIFLCFTGVTMREKKGGALQKLKKRLSHSFGRLSKFFFQLIFSYILFSDSMQIYTIVLYKFDARLRKCSKIGFDWIPRIEKKEYVSWYRQLPWTMLPQLKKVKSYSGRNKKRYQFTCLGWL